MVLCLPHQLVIHLYSLMLFEIKDCNYTRSSLLLRWCIGIDSSPLEAVRSLVLTNDNYYYNCCIFCTTIYDGVLELIQV
jgi:hypothetical protein